MNDYESGQDDKYFGGSETPSGGAPQEVKDKEGFHFSSADRVPNGGLGRDDNRRKNHEKNSSSKTETLKLKLIGQPHLKSKKDIIFLGAGPAASGRWYVEECSHEYEDEGKLITTLSCSRGEKQGGDNSKKKNDSMLIYADIYKPGKIFCTPRPVGKEIQDAFTWGIGDVVLSFQYHLHPQPQRAGNEGCQDCQGTSGESSGGGSGGNENKDKEQGGGGVNVRKVTEYGGNDYTQMQEEKYFGSSEE